MLQQESENGRAEVLAGRAQLQRRAVHASARVHPSAAGHEQMVERAEQSPAPADPPEACFSSPDLHTASFAASRSSFADYLARLQIGHANRCTIVASSNHGAQCAQLQLPQQLKQMKE